MEVCEDAQRSGIESEKKFTQLRRVILWPPAESQMAVSRADVETQNHRVFLSSTSLGLADRITNEGKRHDIQISNLIFEDRIPIPLLLFDGLDDLFR